MSPTECISALYAQVECISKKHALIVVNNDDCCSQFQQSLKEEKIVKMKMNINISYRDYVILYIAK